jgi:hypothetical protein
MTEEIGVIILLPDEDQKQMRYHLGLLVHDGEVAFVEAVATIPGTRFAPPTRLRLDPRNLKLLRAASAGRPALYLYEGFLALHS